MVQERISGIYRAKTAPVLSSGSQFVAFPKRFMDALLLDCINLNTVLILSTDYLRQKNKFFSNPVFGTERSLLPCSKSYSSRQTEGKKHCWEKRHQGCMASQSDFFLLFKQNFPESDFHSSGTRLFPTHPLL